MNECWKEMKKRAGFEPINSRLVGQRTEAWATALLPLHFYDGGLKFILHFLLDDLKKDKFLENAET